MTAGRGCGVGTASAKESDAPSASDLESVAALASKSALPIARELATESALPIVRELKLATESVSEFEWAWESACGLEWT